MRILFISLCIISITVLNATSLIHPLDFKGTKEEKDRLLSFIVSNVYSTYSAIGMDNPLTLRMMEKAELKSFKTLTKFRNRRLMDKVINTYCNINMCNYTTILMMYNAQNKASKKSLQW